MGGLGTVSHWVPGSLWVDSKDLRFVTSRRSWNHPGTPRLRGCLVVFIPIGMGEDTTTRRRDEKTEVGGVGVLERQWRFRPGAVWEFQNTDGMEDFVADLFSMNLVPIGCHSCQVHDTSQ